MEKILSTQGLIKSLRYNIFLLRQENKPTSNLELWLKDALKLQLVQCEEALKEIHSQAS